MQRRWQFWMAALLAACCQSGCLSLENHLLYHPIREEKQTTNITSPYIRDVYLTGLDGKKIHARWFHHPKGTGAILYCPGNAGNLEHRNYAVSELAAEMDQSVLIFDYPGFGKSDGQPSELGCYAAADTAYQWLTKTAGIAPEKILIYGESLGGAVAVELASHRPHRALALIRTFASFPDLAQAKVPFLPVRWMVQNRFDTTDKLTQCQKPIFIAHADKDKLIPQGHAERLKKASPPRSELFVLKGLGHNDRPGPEFYEALRIFLNINAPLPIEFH